MEPTLSVTSPERARPRSAAPLLAGLLILALLLAPILVPIRRRLRVRRMCHPALSPHRLHPRLSCRLPARRLRWLEVWASFVLNLPPYRWVRPFLQLSQWFQVFLHVVQALGYLPWPRSKSLRCSVESRSSEFQPVSRTRPKFNVSESPGAAMETGCNAGR